MKYSLDSDAVINAWRDYPIENFPKIWDWIEQMGRKGVAGMSEVVFKELEKGGDECFAWFKARKELFVYPNDEEVQKELERLVNSYNNFGIITGKNEGDPFVVALAIVNDCTVVTNESMSNNMNGPKVPDVCRAEGIQWIKFVDVIRNEGVTF
ncbi:MAG: DUF4411 family protein [Balneolaceae bacterium]|nr:DUF4411 family protein [Balneolaceae bacterium]